MYIPNCNSNPNLSQFQCEDEIISWFISINPKFAQNQEFKGWSMWFLIKILGLKLECKPLEANAKSDSKQNGKYGLSWVLIKGGLFFGVFDEFLFELFEPRFPPFPEYDSQDDAKTKCHSLFNYK